MPKIGQVVQGSLKPYWTTSDGDMVRLYLGDVLEVLRKLPDKSVQTVITSPPYWGLRDYGTAEWKGGDPACTHRRDGPKSDNAKIPHDGYKSGFRGGENFTDHKHEPLTKHIHEACPRCGARRIDAQIGSEESHDCEDRKAHGLCGKCHVCVMVAVCREIRRVLRDDGTFWLNYGDTYSVGKGGYKESRTEDTVSEAVKGYDGNFQRKVKRGSAEGTFNIPADSGLPAGNLVGIPWRVALALQADGWILRQDIIFAKKSPMPESVRSRCTKAHEFVFLFTKRKDYFYDAEAIRTDAEPAVRNVSGNKTGSYGQAIAAGRKPSGNGVPGSVMRTGNLANKRSVWTIDDERALLSWLRVNHPTLLEEYLSQARNKKDVWRIASSGYDGAHFAVFPCSLIRPMILAGTSQWGCCTSCGSPWKRVTDRRKLKRERPNDYVKRTGEVGTGNSCSNSVAEVAVETIGWEPTCECNGKFVKRTIKKSERYEGYDPNIPKGWTPGRGISHDRVEGATVEGRVDADERRLRAENSEKEWDEETVTITEYVPTIPLEDHPIRPCIVLDPFCGSGTTMQVSIEHGRYSWGIDLSEAYLRNNAIPRIEGVLLNSPATARLVTREVKVVAPKGKTFGKKT